MGLSSLGRSESRVLPAIDAAIATLSGGPAAARPSPRAHESGLRALVREQTRIFGPDPLGPSTRIMMTMPTESAQDAALVRQMIDAGGDCARINCAHDGTEVWRAMIRNVRAAERASGRRCRVLMDLAGPKVRITSVRPDGKVRLRCGDRFVLTDAQGRSGGHRIEATVSHSEVLAKVSAGDEVWINDGKIGARVVRVTKGHALMEVTSARERGEGLRLEKGLNLPGRDLEIPALTRKDLTDLRFVARHADCVGYSFVQRPSDVSRLLREVRRLRRGRAELPVVLKVETALAVRNLPRLIVAAGGRVPVAVMIARGDLAVEIGLGRLSEIQEEILWICEAAHVPVVWATQVLDGMVKDGVASRSEATDAAMGQRAECVMLNKGPHLVEAIRFLDEVLRRMDRHQQKKTARLSPLRSWNEPQVLT
jgi:pyruvate kinase